MKKIFLIAITLLILSCNDNKKQETNDLGFIVEKDYDHTRMCCSQQHFERLMIIVVPHTSPPPHHHHKIDAIFSLWFANRNGATEYIVDSLTWLKYKVGDKVISQTDTNNYHRFFIVKD